MEDKIYRVGGNHCEDKENYWMENVFWKQWAEADEVRKLKLIQGLTGIDESNATLINSYFMDLYEYMLNRIYNLKE